MVENDIYNSQRKYEGIVANLNEMVLPPKEREARKGIDGKTKGKIGKYYCKNKANLEYFRRLFNLWDSKDISFIRRVRLIQSLRLICYSTDQDLKELKREDIDKLVSCMHIVYKSPKSKSDFIRDIKHIWRNLFPERDQLGRIDETLTPHQVRHLSAKMDKSKEKRRQDRLTYEEFERIIDYFSSDPRIQFYLMLALESLGRPQEILYTRIKDIEVFDNYAKIWISSHGKEGTGLLQCIDSFPYLQEWLRQHPQVKDKDSLIFINTGRTNYGRQLTPVNINKKLKMACKDLGIDKPITCYSFKRNGVTFRRLRGDSDVEIQHVARWTSTKQLNTYDKSDQEDALRISLVKKGLLKDERFKEYEPRIKVCPVCSASNGFNSEICSNCKRPLDRKKIEEEYLLSKNAGRDKELLKLVLGLFNKEPTLKTGAVKVLQEDPELKKKFEELIKGV